MECWRDGARIPLDILERQGPDIIFAEPPELVEALKYVRGKKVAVDCGACVGEWTFPLSRHFETVYAFEPHGPNVRVILSRMEKYEVKNVVLWQFALGSKKARVSLIGTYYRSMKVGGRGNDVTMLPLDHFNFETVDLIKTDLEGHDYYSILGGFGIISRTMPVIVFESVPIREAQAKAPYRGPMEILGRLGYKEVYKRRPNHVWVPPS